MTPNDHEAGKVSESPPVVARPYDLPMENWRGWDLCAQAHVLAWRQSRRAESQTGAVAGDYFGNLVARARTAAAKASAKYPQPNYIALKIAEESGEVVRGAVHYAEGRMEWSEVEGEIVQLLAMLFRFVTEGDQVIGVSPPSALEPTPIKETAEPAVPADVQGVTGIPGMIGLSALIDTQGHQKNALVLHFDHEVTDQDRQNIIGAHNAAISLSDYQRLAVENERLRTERDDFAEQVAKIILALPMGYGEGKRGQGAVDGVKGICRRLEAAENKLAEAVKELEWYGEQTRLCRLIHREGDAGRDALASDGGKRARTFLASLTRAEGGA